MHLYFKVLEIKMFFFVLGREGEGHNQTLYIRILLPKVNIFSLRQYLFFFNFVLLKLL